MSLKKWKKITSKSIYKNPYWEYKLDQFSIEDKLGDYHYVHTEGSTLIISITFDKKVILVNQFRYLNNRESLEFPCGSVEHNLPLFENAQKELREETGFRSDELLLIGEFAPYSGVSDEICSVFIAKSLSHAPLKADFTEEFEIIELSKDQLLEHISCSRIWDGMTISAWSMFEHSEYISLLS